MRKCNKLPTLISSVFIGMSVSAYGDDPLSPQELEEAIIDNAQALVDAGEDRKALQREYQQEIQKLKATVDQLTKTLEESTASTKAYADTKASQAEKAAKATANKAQSTANDARKRAINAQSTANNAIARNKMMGWCDCEVVHSSPEQHGKFVRFKCSKGKFLTEIYAHSGNSWCPSCFHNINCCRPCKLSK